MTTNSFVVFAEQQHNTRGGHNTQEASERSGGASDTLTHVLSVIDAWLWIVFALLIVARQAEQWFGVLSGFTLLIGPYPTMMAGALLIVCGATYFVATTHAGARLERLLYRIPPMRPPARPRTVEATAPQPEWTVRTQPRTQAQRRSSASQRVMDMEL